MGEESKVKEYMRFVIQDICECIGPRPPCSPEEAECAQYLKERLGELVDEAQIEEFICHPGSYRAQFRLPMLSIMCVTLFYWLYFLFQNALFLIIPLCILIAAVIIIQTNIMLNVEFIDPLFKKERSTNVVGKLYPEGEVERRIVIGGHHDSNWEFPILRKSWKLFGLLMALPIILNYFLLAAFVLKLILHSLSNPYLFFLELDLTFLIFLTAFIPFLIYGIFNTVSDRPVMGANDNLTSLAVILALASHLKKTSLKNTEIWLVSHGCEEIGDRGSKRFSRKHLDKLIDAIVINIDMIGGKNTQLRFITSELVFTKLSSEIADELAKIAKGLSIPHQKKMIGAYTDSFAYAQNKIQSCSIVGFPEKGVPSHYHTREDTIENLEFDNLWDCFQILLKFIDKVENEETFILKKSLVIKQQ